MQAHTPRRACRKAGEHNPGWGLSEHMTDMLSCDPEAKPTPALAREWSLGPRPNTADSILRHRYDDPSLEAQPALVRKIVRCPGAAIMCPQCLCGACPSPTPGTGAGKSLSPSLTQGPCTSVLQTPLQLGGRLETPTRQALDASNSQSTFMALRSAYAANKVFAHHGSARMQYAGRVAAR